MRLVALGASNLTRGFAALVASARRAWGPEFEILAALGHGRSYGAESRVVLRTLPAILECGLWRELHQRRATPARALITDVGNDIPHGRPPARIVSWVEECVVRLRTAGVDEIVLTDLPLERLRRLSPAAYVFFRSLFFPGSRLPLADAAAIADAVSAGLGQLARRHALRLVRPRAEWYGVDPIHVRRRLQRAAWTEILGAAARATAEHREPGLPEVLALYRLRPERQRLLGVEQWTPQHGTPLRNGGRVFLY